MLRPSPIPSTASRQSLTRLEFGGQPSATIVAFFPHLNPSLCTLPALFLSACENGYHTLEVHVKGPVSTTWTRLLTVSHLPMRLLTCKGRDPTVLPGFDHALSVLPASHPTDPYTQVSEESLRIIHSSWWACGFVSHSSIKRVNMNPSGSRLPPSRAMPVLL
ncbi:hypothetical protein BDV59DRAFT_179728 [Aspergillus ambiguus]|uniref:uncharacterized protein n=1 Tax=Aspergillus ambiguus TaxID=176160 RepID=UPI003CCDCD90